MMDFLTTLLTGGATGLLGTALSFGSKWLQKKQAHAQELDLRRLDIELSQSEAAAAERAIALQAESASEQAAWESLQASYKQERTRFSQGGSPWLIAVDVVRGLTRPALTWIFVVLVGTIYFTLGQDDVVLRDRIVHTVLFLTTSCVLWWFGGRQVDKAPK